MRSTRQRSIGPAARTTSPSARRALPKPPEPFDGDQRIPKELDYQRRKSRPVILPAAPTSLTLEQDLWVRGYCAARACRAGDPGAEMEAGDALIENFRLRFPGVLP